VRFSGLVKLRCSHATRPPPRRTGLGGGHQWTLSHSGKGQQEQNHRNIFGGHIRDTVAAGTLSYSLGGVAGERVHRVPGDARVDEDQPPHPGEHLGQAGLQLRAAQRVLAQVQEVQVGDVGDNGPDLAAPPTPPPPPPRQNRHGRPSRTHTHEREM